MSLEACEKTMARLLENFEGPKGFLLGIFETLLQSFLWKWKNAE